MKESVMICLGWIKSNWSKLYNVEIEQENIFNKIDLNIHFPEGSIKKDGPSAGIAITSAIISMLISNFK